MDQDRLQELLEARAQTEQELEKLRTPMTILFSDIKGSTTYAEKKGDVPYMAMINRHNSILFPIIEAEGGRVVKTIGDSILACFHDPVGAVKAAASMQRALADDRKDREQLDQIHIRVGLHTGMGLLKDGDVFGDVVNAASRVQHQAAVEQVLITDVLLDAAKSAGFDVARIGPAELRGKDEPIDLYAVAWSEAATHQLIEQFQAQYEKRLKDQKKLQQQLEEEFENARDQWRAERRNLHKEIEQLEQVVQRVRQAAREQASTDLQSEIRFQLAEAVRGREQVQQELAAVEEKFENERNYLNFQIASMQATVVEAMERSNNPARLAVTVNEKLEVRLAEAKQQWQLQWDGERKRLTAEIERLKKAGLAKDEKKEAARRALLEKLGKVPAGAAGSAGRGGDQWQKDFEDAKIAWDSEREQFKLKIKSLESKTQRTEDALRSELFQELRSQYAPQLAEAGRERTRLEHEVWSLSHDLISERLRLHTRIEQLEKALPEAQEAARRQTLAELQSQFDEKVEETNRLRSRVERKQQDTIEELESELRRAKKHITSLEEQLKQAKESAYKAQKQTQS